MINHLSCWGQHHGSCGKAPRRLCRTSCPVTRRAWRLSAVVALASKGAKSTVPKGFGSPKPQQSKGIAPDAQCPCGSGALYEACCSPYHQGPASPHSPEALLRSRYSAYVAKDPSFIADTTHPDSPEYTGSRASYMGTVKQTMRRLDPLQLTVLDSQPGATENEAFITFRLKRRVRDPEVKGAAPEVDELTERSRFVRVKGRWMYLDSQFTEEGGEGGKEPQEQKSGGRAESQSPAESEAAPKKKGFFNLF